MERVSLGATSLEAAFIDRTELRVIRVTINQALPQSWIQLYSQRVQGDRVWVSVIRSSGEGVRHNVVCATLVLEIEVVLLQQLHPACLSPSQLGLGWEVTEGGMIRVHDEV